MTNMQQIRYIFIYIRQYVRFRCEMPVWLRWAFGIDVICMLENWLDPIPISWNLQYNCALLSISVWWFCRLVTDRRSFQLHWALSFCKSKLCYWFRCCLFCWKLQIASNVEVVPLIYVHRWFTTIPNTVFALISTDFSSVPETPTKLKFVRILFIH